MPNTIAVLLTHLNIFILFYSQADANCKYVIGLFLLRKRNSQSIHRHEWIWRAAAAAVCILPLRLAIVAIER